MITNSFKFVVYLVFIFTRSVGRFGGWGVFDGKVTRCLREYPFNTSMKHISKIMSCIVAISAFWIDLLKTTLVLDKYAHASCILGWGFGMLWSLNGCDWFNAFPNMPKRSHLAAKVQTFCHFSFLVNCIWHCTFNVYEIFNFNVFLDLRYFICGECPAQTLQ